MWVTSVWGISRDHPSKPRLRNLGRIARWIEAYCRYILSRKRRSNADFHGWGPCFIGRQCGWPCAAVRQKRAGRFSFCGWMRIRISTVSTPRRVAISWLPRRLLYRKAVLKAISRHCHTQLHRPMCVYWYTHVDPAERAAIQGTDILIHDMRAIDEYGVRRVAEGISRACQCSERPVACQPGCGFSRFRSRPGRRHNGARWRNLPEAHLVMEMLHDSALVTSLDLVELNRFWTSAAELPRCWWI